MNSNINTLNNNNDNVNVPQIDCKDKIKSSWQIKQTYIKLKRNA